MGTKDAIGEDVSLPINSLTLDNKILGVAIRGRMLERIEAGRFHRSFVCIISI